jgi:hypothetical protein
VTSTDGLTAVSCASQSFCVAVDGAGRALIGQPPVTTKCVVPDVTGDRLSAARHAIRAASCVVGRVPAGPKPKAPNHRKWKLVVGDETPRTGSVEPARGRVRLTLVYKAV